MPRLNKKTPAKAAKTVVTQKAKEPNGAWSSPFVHSSSVDPLRGFTMILLGVEGAGKSVMASTIASNFPKVLPTGKKPVLLEKVFYITTDGSACAAFPSLGIEVPFFDVIEFAKNPAMYTQPYTNGKGVKKAAWTENNPPTFTDALNRAGDLFRDWLAYNPGGACIIDSLSTLAQVLLADYDVINVEQGKAASKMLPLMYLRTARATRMFHYKLRFVGARTLIYLSHLKAEGTFDMDAESTEAAEMIRKAGRTLDGARIIPDLSPAQYRPFKRDAPLQLLVSAKDPGRNKAKIRELHTVQHDDIESKNKFEHLLDPKEPPNLNLLMQKIEKASRV